MPAGEQVVTNVTFDVLARRASAGPARDVTLPISSRWCAAAPR
jgi:hypothetical protein